MEAQVAMVLRRPTKAVQQPELLCLSVQLLSSFYSPSDSSYSLSSAFRGPRGEREGEAREATEEQPIWLQRETCKAIDELPTTAAANMTTSLSIDTRSLAASFTALALTSSSSSSPSPPPQPPQPLRTKRQLRRLLHRRFGRHTVVEIVVRAVRSSAKHQGEGTSVTMSGTITDASASVVVLCPVELSAAADLL